MRNIFTVILFFYVTGISTTVYAQNRDTNGAVTDSALNVMAQHTLTEVVVSATGNQKWKEDSVWKENPSSIRVVSQNVIEQTTEDNLLDALIKNVPGFETVKTGPNVSKPFIHGFGYNRIETVYDGVPVENQTFEDEEVLPVDNYNIDNEEVILGPSTLMYGFDALVGVVSLSPSMPKDTDKIIHGRTLDEYQSNNGLIGNGLQLSYGSSHWAVEVRGTERIAKNYTDPIDGRVYNTGFQETDASAAIIHKSNNGYSSLNFAVYNDLQGIPDGSRDSLTRQFTYPIYDDPLDNIKDRPVVPDAVLNSYQLSPVHQHIQQYMLYTNNHYDFSNHSSIDGMISVQQNIRREYDYPLLPNTTGVSNRLNTLDYDFRFHFPEFSHIETIAGVNGKEQNNTNINPTDIPIPNYNLLDGGFFLFAHLKHNRWNISGGARADALTVTGNNFYVQDDTAESMVKEVTPPDTAGAHLLFPAFKRTFTGISAALGATYQINEYLNIKANMSRGTGAPDVSEFAANGLDASAHAYFIGKSNIASEYSWQEDVGLWLNTGSLDASVSVFNNNLQNYIYLIEKPLEIIPGNPTYQYEQAAAQLYGAESTLNLYPSFIKGFSFNNSFSLMYGFNRNAEYENQGVNGEYLPLIPPMKLLSSVNQEIRVKSKIVPLISLKAEVEMDAAQNRYLALNGTETATPGYTLVNAAVNFTVRYTKKSVFHLQIQGNNIFNVAYQSNLSRLKYLEYYSYSPKGHYGIYNMGRNLCVKSIIPF